MTLDAFPETKVDVETLSDERYTPRHVFDLLHREFGFTLDACATPESAKCTKYFTQAQDGLHQSWLRERVFVNPPYSDIRPWIEKAWLCSARLVVMLVPAWTDRAWWHDFVEPYRDGRMLRVTRGMNLRTRFLRGRIHFGVPGNVEGIGAGPAPFWSALLIFEHTHE